MLKSKVEISLSKNANSAGQAIAKACIGGADKINFIFVSPKYSNNEFIKGLQSSGKVDNVVGFTTNAMLTKDGCILNEEEFAGIMSIEDEDLKLGFAGASFAGSARETGRKAAKEALKDAGMDFAPDYFFMSASNNEDQYLKGVQDIIGRVPLFGASPATSDNSHLFFRDKIIKDGVILAFFYSNKEINTKYSGMYSETKKVGVVTKVSDDYVLAEINGQPAFEVYAKMKGKSVEELKKAIKTEYIFSPLGINDRLGDLTSLRSLIEVLDDGSMRMGAKMAENTAVILMDKVKDDFIEDTETIIKFLKATVNEAGAYLLFNSQYRSMAVSDMRDALLSKIKAIIGDVPFIMPVTSSQYGYADDQNNSVGNLMMSFTVFEK